MNIIEAVKIGKSFRRKGHHTWFSSLGNGLYHAMLISEEKVSGEFIKKSLWAKDILADDWEVKDE